MKTSKLQYSILRIILLVVLSQAAIAQKEWKKYIVSGSSAFASGFLDGTIETISYHYYNGFKTRFPNANDQFWNPELSWRNKYKNGDPTLGPKFTGSTTFFAATTDAYHLLRTAKRTLDGFTVVHYMNSNRQVKMNKKKRIIKTVKDFVIISAIRSVGFHLSYSLLFKPTTTR